MDQPIWHTVFGRLGDAWRLENASLVLRFDHQIKPKPPEVGLRAMDD